MLKGRWPLLAACLLLFSLTLSPVRAGTAEPPGLQGVKLLFLGNSLTYTNDLPDMLERLLEQNGVKVAQIDSRARPDFGLQDHWSSSQSMNAIAQGPWDLVILQQGPSATEGRPSLLEFSERFAEPIREAGAEPVLYMVWPSAARLRDFPGVAESYRMAAAKAEGYLFPVGEAWLYAWRQNPKIRLYGRDGFHPSRLGTYLAALVMFQQISGIDPRGLPPEIPGLRKGDPIKPEIARVLQDAAFQANGNLADADRTLAAPCLACQAAESLHQGHEGD